MNIKNIIFDFGGVLVDWNPRYLYKEHFATEAEMEDFLENICTDAWNIEQDRGRPLAEATKLLQDFFEQFDGIVVSGVEKLIKPDHTFFHLLLNRYHIKAKESVFIDDNAANIKAAKEIGFHTVHFKSAEQLREELEGVGIL